MRIEVAGVVSPREDRLQNTDHPRLAAGPRWTGVTIVDLDRTITRRGTYSPFLIHAARRLAGWRLALVPLAIATMLLYKARLITRRRLKEAMHRLLLGSTVARSDVERAARSFAARTVRTGVHAQATAFIDRERSRGRLVIVATAAHRFYAQEIAGLLGVRDVVATESVWIGNVLTPRIAGENCYGQAKAAAVRDRLELLGVDRRTMHVAFCSDDLSDLPCFEASDEPIVVNPSNRLRRHASGAGWPVLEWRSG